MLRLTVAVLLLVSALAFPSRYEAAQGRIIAGSKATLGQLPYMAEIQLEGKHQCGATIYSNRWLITAAHCVRGQSEADLVIFTGSTTLNGGDQYKVQKIVEHRQYNPTTKQNDLALIKTATDIVFNDNVKSIPLADSEPADDADVIISGWGFTSWPGTIPNDLMFLRTKILNRSNCTLRMLFFNVVTENQVCTFTHAGEGMCGGDSGGPGVHDGKLIGVVNWGIPCGAGYPDIYANVFNYRDWITMNAD